MAAADRVAADSLATPRAVVTFHAHVASPASGGTLGTTLLAVAEGIEPVEFELDPRVVVGALLRQRAVSRCPGTTCRPCRPGS